MKRTTWLRHDSQVRSNAVCTQNSDTFDITPATKNTRLALTGYVNESERLLALQKQKLEERTAATEQCRVCRRALRSAGRAVVKVGKLVNVPDTLRDHTRDSSWFQRQTCINVAIIAGKSPALCDPPPRDGDPR